MSFNKRVGFLGEKVKKPEDCLELGIVWVDGIRVYSNLSMPWSFMQSLYNEMFPDNMYIVVENSAFSTFNSLREYVVIDKDFNIIQKPEFYWAPWMNEFFGGASGASPTEIVICRKLDNFERWKAKK